MNHLDINNELGTIRIINSSINEDVCIWKHRAFEKSKGSHTIFVETGTNTGNGVANALALDFKEIYSIEIMEEKYRFAMERWKDFPNVHLYCGPTSDHMEDVLSTIHEPCFFWLDAHFGTGTPVYAELEAIKNHPIKTHTILIDDMTKYFVKSEIESIIKQINPDYIISYEPTPHHPEEILVAKIP
jgi:hypothetical protein